MVISQNQLQILSITFYLHSIQIQTQHFCFCSHSKLKGGAGDVLFSVVMQHLKKTEARNNKKKKFLISKVIFYLF